MGTMEFYENASITSRYFIVYYLIDDKELTVTVVRIFYGGRDIEGIINFND